MTTHLMYAFKISKKSISTLIVAVIIHINSIAGDRNKLIAYDFGLTKKTVIERLQYLDSLGFDGITFGIRKPAQIPLLKQYVANRSVLPVTAVYVPYSFYADSAEQKVWKTVADCITNKGAMLWIIFLDSVPRETAILKLTEMAQYAKDRNITLVLYPHDNTYLCDAESSVLLIKEAGLKNVFTSFHLCHELRAGHGNRLTEAAQNTAPYLKLVSISGADTATRYAHNKSWSDVIKPLGEGTFDLHRFTNALKAIGYTGPVAIHTFGIEKKPGEHLPESIKIWQKLANE